MDLIMEKEKMQFVKWNSSLPPGVVNVAVRHVAATSSE